MMPSFWILHWWVLSMQQKYNMFTIAFNFIIFRKSSPQIFKIVESWIWFFNLWKNWYIHGYFYDKERILFSPLTFIMLCLLLLILPLGIIWSTWWLHCLWPLPVHFFWRKVMCVQSSSLLMENSEVLMA